MSERRERDAGGTGADPAGEELAARGYRHTPGNEGAGNAASGGAGTAGGGPEAVDEFGADPGGREWFDAGNAYGADVGPDEMGGLPPAAGGTGRGGASGG